MHILYYNSYEGNITRVLTDIFFRIVSLIFKLKQHLAIILITTLKMYNYYFCLKTFYDINKLKIIGFYIRDIIKINFKKLNVQFLVFKTSINV